MKIDTFTFMCLVDFCQAFDSVNHSVLWNIMIVAGDSFEDYEKMHSNLAKLCLIEWSFNYWFSNDVRVRQWDNLVLHCLQCSLMTWYQTF